MYRKGNVIVADCACGGVIVALGDDEYEVYRQVRWHVQSTVHVAWRERGGFEEAA